MTEGTASGSLRASVLAGRCLAELRLLTRTLRTFHAVLHPAFPLSHPSTQQPRASSPQPRERHWRCSNAVVTVLGKPKGLYAPLGIAFTKETRSDPDTAWHLTLSCQERLFLPHVSYFWLVSGLCCQQSGGLLCATAVAWQFVLHCPTDSSARISQWCISWCLAKAGVQPAPQCSRRIILPKPWP